MGWLEIIEHEKWLDFYTILRLFSHSASQTGVAGVIEPSRDIDNNSTPQSKFKIVILIITMVKSVGCEAENENNFRGDEK
jgi:hypothetical protein